MEEQKSEDASGSKRARREQMSPTTSPSTPQPTNWEPAGSEAEEVIDVETLSPRGAEGLQGDLWNEFNLREVEEPSDTEEPEHSSCDEIIVVDGDGQDEDTDGLESSGRVAHRMSIRWSECSKYQNEEEEEEIDVVSEQNLHPSTAGYAIDT